MLWDIYALQGNGPVIIIPTHTPHCNRLGNLCSTHTTHVDAYMKLSTSIAGGGLVHTYPFTPLYKVDVQKDKVEGNSCHILEVCA